MIANEKCHINTVFNVKEFINLDGDSITVQDLFNQILIVHHTIASASKIPETSLLYDYRYYAVATITLLGVYLCAAYFSFELKDLKLDIAAINDQQGRLLDHSCENLAIVNNTQYILGKQIYAMNMMYRHLANIVALRPPDLPNFNADNFPNFSDIEP